MGRTTRSNLKTKAKKESPIQAKISPKKTFKNENNDTLIIIKSPENGGPAEQIADIKTSLIEHMCNKCNKKYTTSIGLKRHLKVCSDLKNDLNLKIPDLQSKTVENHNDLSSRNLNLIVISESTTDSGIEEATNSVANSQASDDSHNSSTDESATLNTSKNPYEFDEEVDDPVVVPVPVADDPNLCQCCGEDINTAHKAGPYKCEVCVKYFKKKDTFQRHNTNFHSTDKTAIKCPKCPVVCLNKAIFLEHEVLHASVFECEHCSKTFSRKYNLTRHQQLGCDPKQKKVKMFKCQACGNEFTRKDNLLTHLRMHLGKPANQKEFTCEYCSNKYRGKAAYAIHVRIHTGETPFKCQYCPKAFRAKLALVKHERRHTGERPFSCSQCGKSFSAKETLNRHVLTHTEEKPYCCGKCGMSFIQMMQLRAHMFHHTGQMTFKCKHCDMSFINNNRLTTHVKYTHEGASKLSCPNCSKTFFRQDELTKHLAIHSDVKMFGCDDCGKKFKTKQLLICHTKTHRKEQPRTCPLCPRAFIRFDCLLRHFRSRHNEHYKTALMEAKKTKFEMMRSKISIQKVYTIRKRMQTFGPEPLSPYVLTHLKEISKDVEFTNLKSKIKQKTNKDKQTPQEILIQIAEHGVAEDFEVEIVDIPLSESYLASSIQELLELLIDRESFEAFNWCNESVDDILEGLIIKCGHSPADSSITERAQRLRENAKLLLTVVIDDSAIQALFETQTVDEVILSVLRLGKSSG